MDYRAVGLLMAIGLMTAIGACGDGPDGDDARQAAAAIRQLHKDIVAERFSAACDGMTDNPAREIGSIGHGRQPTTCVRDLKDFVYQNESNAGVYGMPSLLSGPEPNVTDVRVASDGRTAVARARLDGGDPYPIRLAKEDDDWKVDDFFGAQAPAPKELR